MSLEETKTKGISFIGEDNYVIDPFKVIANAKKLNHYMI